MKCGKFMWWAFGKNSWMCRKLKICLCKQEPPVPPIPPIPPEPPIPPPPPPPPPMINVDVCTKTGLLARDTCKAIGYVDWKMFIEGEEPIEECDRHAIGEMKAPRKYARSGIWDWLAVLHTAWDEDKELYALEQWFFKCREIFKRGVHSMAGFIFVDTGSTEHKHFWNKVPYLWLPDKGKYDLYQPSPRYWELAEKMTRIVKLFNEPNKERFFQPCLTMERYDERPFVLNVNDVSGLKTQKALPFVGNLLRWWIDMTRRVYGPGHNPPHKDANEFTHGGHVDWDGGRIQEFTFNSRFHRYLTDIAVFEYGIPIWKETVDTSHSEGCSAGVNEWAFAEKDNLWHGYKPEEIVIKRSVPTMCVLMEKHGCGSEASWKEYSGYHGDPNFFVSGNKQILFSVDGGTGFIRDGKGYVIGGANGFYWPNKEQWRNSVYTAASEAARKNKRIYFEWAAPEIFMKRLPDGSLVFDKYLENPDYTLPDYEFLDIMIEVIDEVYGQP